MELIFLNPKYLWLLLSIPLLILIHLFSLRFLRARSTSSATISWGSITFRSISRKRTTSFRVGKKSEPSIAVLRRRGPNTTLAW